MQHTYQTEPLMKSLQQIKDEYAHSKKCKNWEDFCLVANDYMFAEAVDDIATLYAACRSGSAPALSQRSGAVSN